MSVVTISGKLTGIGVNVLGDYTPRLTVRPEVEAWGPDGLVSSRPVPVGVSSTSGNFDFDVIPSHELVGKDGRVGVRYKLELILFDGGTTAGRGRVRDVWTFTALPGGGSVEDMGSGPALGLYVGPPWPSQPVAGTFFDPSDGDLSYYEIEVHA